mmetsp:Transcript_56225/g.93456  ORF Transcript_56225/g.93456 Transcript_56225/m.93456 type:complete len:201 (-) Transcript_56225:236-838(-)
MSTRRGTGLLWTPSPWSGMPWMCRRRMTRSAVRAIRSESKHQKEMDELAYWSCTKHSKSLDSELGIIMVACRYTIKRSNGIRERAISRSSRRTFVRYGYRSSLRLTALNTMVVQSCGSSNKCCEASHQDSSLSPASQKMAKLDRSGCPSTIPERLSSCRSAATRFFCRCQSVVQFEERCSPEASPSSCRVKRCSLCKRKV